MSDFYLILNSIVALALVLLGLVAIINERRAALNALFLAFTLSIGIWLVAAAISNDPVNSPHVSLYGNYLVFAFSYLTSFLLLWFSVLVTGNSRIRHWLLGLTPLLLVGAFVSATPLVVAGVVNQGSVYAVKFGPLVAVYAVLLLAQLIATIVVLALGSRHASGRKREQIKVLLQTISIAVPILLLTQFIIPAITGSFDMTNIGILAMILPVLGLYISIIRHGLFDIRLVAVRTLAYVLSLMVLAGIYYVIAYVVTVIAFQGDTRSSTVLNPLNVMIALGLAFLFQPIKQLFDRVTDAIFYRDTYNVDDFFAEITKRLSASTEVHNLLYVAATDIADTLKASFGSFFVYREGKLPLTIATDHHRHAFPIDDARVLDVYAQQHRGQVIVRSQLVSEDDDTKAIRRLLISHRLELVLPIFRDEAILGYLLLGSHLSGHYTIRDIRTLVTIADELAIAIENALSVQEVRDLNDTLQQRISDATRELRHSNSQLQQLDAAKDEFISMASHQLRTPLTTIKGYISMVIEGDAGKITSGQKHLLEEAFTSSERMVRLISDFLNVSRLQTGKFVIEKQPTNLAKVIREELDSLSPNASARGIKFVYKEPKNFPTLYLDETKIRQVIMNFSDNALYYSGKGKTVDINLKLEKGEVIFTVKDHGIGVPKEQQAHLFEKFFRATNARSERPDGTGVGLFLAKRVIDDHHGGLIFDSAEGKGSTFGFRLPLSEAQVPDNQKPLA